MKIIIVDSVHDILIHKLKDKNFDVTYQPEINESELLKVISQYDGNIIRSKLKITSAIIDKARKLKFIGRVGAGLENIDIKYAENKGIKCFNSPEGNRDAVGEQALGMLLCLLNNLYRANTEVKHGLWQREKNRGVELKNKTVGIIGYGNMGSAFAEKLKGLGCNVIAYDKYKFNFSNEFIREVGLDYLKEETDILSLHVPITEETLYMANNDFFQSFRKPFYLINTARGPIVKTDEVITNLKNGKILGAALDVLEFEKTNFEELYQSETLPSYLKELTEMENVLLSPHIAGWTNESNRKLSEIIAIKIIREYIL